MNQIEFYEAKLQYETDSWDLSEALKNHEGVVVIDTRSKEAYAVEHIPSAINLPHRDMSVETTQEFDPTMTYVTYCDGIGCNASTKGAVNLTRLGFKVKELLGGLDWWKRDGHVTVETSASKANNIHCGC